MSTDLLQSVRNHGQMVDSAAFKLDDLAMAFRTIGMRDVADKLEDIAADLQKSFSSLVKAKDQDLDRQLAEAREGAKATLGLALFLSKDERFAAKVEPQRAGENG